MRCEKVLLVVGLFLTSFVGGIVGGVMVDSPVFAERVQSPGIVTTTQVNVVDADGRLRAVLAGQDERRMASLSFYDPAGLVRGVIGIDETGTPVVRLFDSAGQSRLSALVQGDDPLVIVGNESARSGVLGALGGSPFLSLFDAGVSRARLQLDAEGAPSLGLFDPVGRQSIAFTVDEAGFPLMTLHEEGRVRAAFGVREQATLLNLSSAERVRLVIGVAADGNPTVSFLAENGEIVQQLPLQVGQTR